MLELTVWSAVPDAEEPAAPAFTGYTVTSTGWEKKTPEEIPAEIFLRVPGICSACTVRVDPDPVPQIRKRLTEFGEKLARFSDGAYTEPHPAGEPARVRFFTERTFPVMTEFSPRVTLSLWFPGGPAVRALRESLLLTLLRILPFALPESYGETNPPERTSADPSNLSEVAAFLAHCDRPVWFPRSPVGNVFLRDNAQAEEGKSGYFSLTVPESLYDGSPEWREALSRLLVRLCDLYDAFFGQIVRGNPGVSGGTWQGIPENLGEVCWFGGPYRDLPKTVAEGKLIPGGTPAGHGVLFTAPDLPGLPQEVIAFPKKTLFGKHKGEKRGYALPGDFRPAKTIPAECVTHR